MLNWIVFVGWRREREEEMGGPDVDRAEIRKLNVARLRIQSAPIKLER